MDKEKENIDLTEMGKSISSLLSNIEIHKPLNLNEDDSLFLKEMNATRERKQLEDERKRKDERKKEVRYWIFSLIIAIISFLMGKYL